MEIYRDILIMAFQRAINEEAKRLKALFGEDFNPVYLEMWRIAEKELKEPGAQLHIRDDL